MKWDIPKADFERILRDNRLFSPGRESFYQDGQGDITRFPQKALDTKTWHRLGFHGIGGEWLSTSIENITTLFQFLDKHRNEIWIAPTGTVWKYMREREGLAKLDVEPMSSGMVIKPTFDPDKFEDIDLYTVPLTLKVPVPADWYSATVTVGHHNSKLVHTQGGVALVEFTPQDSSIHLTKG